MSDQVQSLIIQRNQLLDQLKQINTTINTLYDATLKNKLLETIIQKVKQQKKILNSLDQEYLQYKFILDAKYPTELDKELEKIRVQKIKIKKQILFVNNRMSKKSEGQQLEDIQVKQQYNLKLEIQNLKQLNKSRLTQIQKSEQKLRNYKHKIQQLNIKSNKLKQEILYKSQQMNSYQNNKISYQLRNRIQILKQQINRKIILKNAQYNKKLKQLDNLQKKDIELLQLQNLLDLKIHESKLCLKKLSKRHRDSKPKVKNIGFKCKTQSISKQLQNLLNVPKEIQSKKQKIPYVFQKISNLQQLYPNEYKNLFFTQYNIQNQIQKSRKYSHSIMQTRKFIHNHNHSHLF